MVPALLTALELMAVGRWALHWEQEASGEAGSVPPVGLWLLLRHLSGIWMLVQPLEGCWWEGRLCGSVCGSRRTSPCACCTVGVSACLPVTLYLRQGACLSVPEVTSWCTRMFVPSACVCVCGGSAVCVCGHG